MPGRPRRRGVGGGEHVGGYEVQGRRRVAGDPGGRRAREEVRLAAAEDRVTALRAAASMAAEGFTAWVFRIDQRSGRRTYSLVEKLSPTDA